MLPALQRIANSPVLRPAYRAARRRRFRQSIAAYAPRVVEHTYDGTPLRVCLRDPLAEGWYDHDWDTQPELDLLGERGRLTPGAVVFDLGAHQGVVALMCAARVGEGSVIAVEAERHNVAVARENAQLNPRYWIHVEHAAVAAECGTVWFSEGLNGAVLPGGGRAGRTRVRAVTIDELATRHGHPDVVLDVEGFEGRALEGASRVLEGRRTDLFVEIHDAATIGPHGWDGERVVTHLADHGAEVWLAPAPDGPPQPFVALSAAAEVDLDRRTYCVALFA
jgi:FkbM family methyltransferase